jgi:hypothetical protein
MTFGARPVDPRSLAIWRTPKRKEVGLDHAGDLIWQLFRPLSQKGAGRKGDRPSCGRALHRLIDALGSRRIEVVHDDIARGKHPSSQDDRIGHAFVLGLLERGEDRSLDRRFGLERSVQGARHAEGGFNDGHHETTKLDAVVSVGVTPLPSTMAGLIGPLQRIWPVPFEAVPSEANVAVPPPPVPVGNEMFDSGLEAPTVAVVHPPDRETATRE